MKKDQNNLKTKKIALRMPKKKPKKQLKNKQG